VVELGDVRSTPRPAWPAGKREGTWGADAEHYNYFRDYDPSIGRYVESDPIGVNGGLNSFAYVGENPLVGIDPTGLIAFGFGRSGSIGVSAAIPFIGRWFGLGFGLGVTMSQCCGKDKNVYNQAVASFRSGVSFGLSLQPTPSGRGMIPVFRAGPLPPCLEDDALGYFKGMDVAAGPVSVQIRKDTLDVGVNPVGVGGSITFNLIDKQWLLRKQDTGKKCSCPYEGSQ
jgi:RHS repeat-associated protein